MKSRLPASASAILVLSAWVLGICSQGAHADSGCAYSPVDSIVVFGGANFRFGERSLALRKRSLASNIAEVFWTPPLDSLEGAVLYEDIGFSPDGRFVAFRALLPVPSEHGMRDNWVLYVLDVHGREVRAVPGGCRYAWSPDGQEMGVIHGTFVASGRGFSPERMCILRPEGGAELTVEGLYQALAWPRFDGHLYMFYRGQAFCWRRGATCPEPVAYQAINFSSDGTYCLYPSVKYIEPGYDIYSRTTNQPITQGDRCAIERVLVTKFAPSMWLGDKTLLVYRYMDSLQQYLVNMETGATWRPPRPVVAAAKDDEAVVTYDEDADVFAVEAIADFHLLSPQDVAALSVSE